LAPGLKKVAAFLAPAGRNFPWTGRKFSVMCCVMRIISGQSGGIPIQVPKQVTRPTTDRVRAALFNILANKVPGAAALDLFSGSGAYGLESLSRGAVSCVFVESDRLAAEVIRANLSKAKLPGGSVLNLKVESALAKMEAGSFDLIFADPPYKKLSTDHDYDAQLLASPVLPGLLRVGGLFVLESFSKRPSVVPADAPWKMVDERSYGDTVLRFYAKGAEAGNE
jgi:16S rRNA (guanine966-N2)-methyltransferase